MNFSRKALFHKKNRVCPKYFVHDCRNVVIFSVDNSSSIHTGSRWCYNGKNFSINFIKANTKFSSSLHYSGDESYLYANKTEICKFMVHDNIPWHKFCFASVPKDFAKDEMSEISLNQW